MCFLKSFATVKKGRILISFISSIQLMCIGDKARCETRKSL